MKKVLIICMSLLMVYGLTAYKVFSSEIKTVTTTNATTSTCWDYVIIPLQMDLIDPSSPSFPGTIVSIPLYLLPLWMGSTQYFCVNISYDDTVFENPRIESFYGDIYVNSETPGTLEVSGSGPCYYSGSVATILFDIKETAIPGTYSFLMDGCAPMPIIHGCYGIPPCYLFHLSYYFGAEVTICLPITVTGVIERGVECWMLNAFNGERYSLLGCDSDLCMEGQIVEVTGCVREVSICIEGVPFEVVSYNILCQCPADSPLGCISGTVIHASTRRPLQGMTVTLRRLSPRPRVKIEVTTDSDGCYLFTDLEDGKYKIWIKGCEVTGKRTVIITGGKKVNNKNIEWWYDIYLRRCFYLIGN